MPEPSVASFDREAVNDKYAEERNKRMIEGRAATRDLTADAHFSCYRDDPFTPYVERDPIEEQIDVAIIGAGLAGVLAGADLRAAGIERIRLVDGAGGIGGTWYWNRYPGVMCDVESYVYMPKLEEMGHVPTTRYAFGDEIRRHLDAVARRYDLADSALFHTTVQQSEWDEESARWILTTDRGDVIRAHYLVVAPGILNLMKLPAIPGMEEFRGRSFHSARWDYGYTGGGPDDPHLTKLADKVVGIIGTGASAIQAVPPLAASAEHLYVFQRTPSAIGVRGNRTTPDDFADGLAPGWQRRRMENFSAVMTGVAVEQDLTDDGWTHHMGKLANPEISEGMSLDEIMLSVEEFDYSVMEEHRSRVGALVDDERVAESLKPYYRYLCKRPCFHDEYLPTFNRDNVTLVDSPAGIERVTERGVVVQGEEIALDCIVYATGFEAEITPFPRRATHPIVGRGGLTIAEKFADGPITLHGLMTGGFPNMFLMPAPGLQSVVTVNYTHLAVEGAEHIAGTIAMLERRGIRVADVLPAAEQDWTAEVVSAYQDTSGALAACTPSRINFEGDVSQANPRTGTYRGGFGDFFAYQQLLRDWRARGDFAGLQLEHGPDAATSGPD
jgi:cation diffusion facilitator CzcD-associated flavoprotein CzcO